MHRSKLSVLVLTVALVSACATSKTKAPTPTLPPSTAAKSAAATNITGAWNLSVQTPMGSRDMKLNAMQSGDTLTGSIASPRGDVPITGTVKGNAIAFVMKVNAQGMDLQIDYAGTIEGDSMKGTAKFGDYGDGTFTGKKQ